MVMNMQMFKTIFTTKTKSPKLPHVLELREPVLDSSLPVLLSFSGETRCGRHTHGKQAAEATSSMWREARETSRISSSNSHTKVGVVEDASKTWPVQLRA